MKFLDKCNAAYGAIVTVLVAILGPYWYIFAGYRLTGWYKARKLGKESSKTGLKGILKKMGYWIIILIAFLMPKMFISLGHDILGINLDFLLLFGWFTLACLLVNEIRSVLENLVECGYNVPEFLIKGLAVTQKLINAETEKTN